MIVTCWSLNNKVGEKNRLRVIAAKHLDCLSTGMPHMDSVLYYFLSQGVTSLSALLCSWSRDCSWPEMLSGVYLSEQLWLRCLSFFFYWALWIFLWQPTQLCLCNVQAWTQLSNSIRLSEVDFGKPFFGGKEMLFDGGKLDWWCTRLLMGFAMLLGPSLLKKVQHDLHIATFS